eukprot:scaffold104_cov375-Prasinococcus_capsulatus_cf.AAC.17
MRRLGTDRRGADSVRRTQWYARVHEIASEDRPTKRVTMPVGGSPSPWLLGAVASTAAYGGREVGSKRRRRWHRRGSASWNGSPSCRAREAGFAWRGRSQEAVRPAKECHQCAVHGSPAVGSASEHRSGRGARRERLQRRLRETYVRPSSLKRWTHIQSYIRDHRVYAHCHLVVAGVEISDVRERAESILQDVKAKRKERSSRAILPKRSHDSAWPAFESPEASSATSSFPQTPSKASVSRTSPLVSTQPLVNHTHPADDPRLISLRKKLAQLPKGLPMPSKESFVLRPDLVRPRLKNNVVLVTWANWHYLDFTLNW